MACIAAAYKDYLNEIGWRLYNPSLSSTAETTALMKKEQVVSESVIFSQGLSHLLFLGAKKWPTVRHIPKVCYERVF